MRYQKKGAVSLSVKQAAPLNLLFFIDYAIP